VCKYLVNKGYNGVKSRRDEKESYTQLFTCLVSSDNIRALPEWEEVGGVNPSLGTILELS